MCGSVLDARRPLSALPRAPCGAILPQFSWFQNQSQGGWPLSLLQIWDDLSLFPWMLPLSRRKEKSFQQNFWVPTTFSNIFQKQKVRNHSFWDQSVKYRAWPTKHTHCFCCAKLYFKNKTFFHSLPTSLPSFPSCPNIIIIICLYHLFAAVCWVSLPASFLLSCCLLAWNYFSRHSKWLYCIILYLITTTCLQTEREGPR